MAKDKSSRKDSSWSDMGADTSDDTSADAAVSVPSVEAATVDAAPVDAAPVDAAPVKATPSREKDLTVTTPEEAKVAGTVTTGLADRWLCVAKAVNEREGWMKSTKAMQVGAGGCLIQVTTQQKNVDGTWAIAEAVCFAHGVSLVEVDGQGRFLT
jgi:hypothetical protein